ncbi:DUF6776 family protein [Chitinimonas taiwanensis]|uniref:Uncharacterized protein n=1 Tax=Chitinimonas taiwanensis DSM 18899 TaxID=1121279 RepID=A0A1K2HMU1_9NEIS|nr:DUF6776 family protein [Chitinimonas taiwanensis]SFZ78043.1 hypothetical protein SAMN02745887_02751 [Chitinimonas taiwanensis DSM 18899]
MLRRWKRRGNHLATARLAVRRHLPWYAWVGLVLLALCLLAGASWLLFQHGQEVGRQDPHAQRAIQEAARNAGTLEKALSEARQKQAETEQQLRLELATRQTMTRQLQQLQADNGSLRERIGFYESLLTKTDRAPALAIEVFRVEPLTPGHYRLSAILLQGQSSQEAFKGEMQFRLTIERQGKREIIAWPQTRIPLSVSRFLRLERETDLPADTVLKRVEMAIYAAGETRPRLTRIYEVKG